MKELGGKSENNPSLDKAWLMQRFSFFAPQDFFFAFKTQKIQKKQYGPIGSFFLTRRINYSRHRREKNYYTFSGLFRVTLQGGRIDSKQKTFMVIWQKGNSRKTSRKGARELIQGRG